MNRLQYFEIIILSINQKKILDRYIMNNEMDLSKSIGWNRCILHSDYKDRSKSIGCKQIADSTKMFLNWWGKRCILHYNYMEAQYTHLSITEYQINKKVLPIWKLLLTFFWNYNFVKFIIFRGRGTGEAAASPDSRGWLNLFLGNVQKTANFFS